MAYLVTTTTRVAEGTPDEAVQDIRAGKAAAREPAARGHLLRLWRPPRQAEAPVGETSMMVPD
jgi:muconolactone D-isomerase